MALKLISDFVDYYDHAFSTDGSPFVRNSKGGPNRIEALNMMSAVGLEVPKHGYVKDLHADLQKGVTNKRKFSKYSGVVHLVVYTDLQAHRGEGKELMTLRKAFKKFPDAYASQYLPSGGHGTHGTDASSETLRCQVIGDEVIWMVFHSDDKWRSNCGKVDISYISGMDNLYKGMENIQLPFYAIDFVSPYGRHGANDLIAIDLNVAPGLQNTPVQEMYSPTEIAQHITRKHQEINW